MGPGSGERVLVLLWASWAGSLFFISTAGMGPGALQVPGRPVATVALPVPAMGPA